MNIPSFKNRSPAAIVTDHQFFDSSARIFRAMSWIEYAKESRNISAMEYAALETRIGIEQLLFEQLIVGAGTRLDAAQYKKCKGKATQLSHLLESLIPKYELLVEFTRAMSPVGFPVTKWDNRRLIRDSGTVSNYLHWSGGLDSTVQSSAWLDKALEVVGTAAGYVWTGITTGNTAFMRLDDAAPEIQGLWDLFSRGEISADAARQRANKLDPILRERCAASLEPLRIDPHYTPK